MSTSAAEEIFRANRAIGRIALSISDTPLGPARTRVRESGSLRVRFPNSQTNTSLEAVIINTAGGMAGGDRFNCEINVGAGARLIVTTAAAEKIYRSLGPATEIILKLDIGRDGSLVWLPQATICFDGMHLHRTIDVTLARTATLLLSEATVFGRSGMGERVRQGRFFDRRRVRVDGSLVFAETIGLDSDIARRLAEAAVAKGGIAVASVLKIPATDGCATAVRSMQDSFVGEVGISAWNGLAVARLVAPDSASLQRDLIGVLSALGAKSLPRLWLN